VAALTGTWRVLAVDLASAVVSVARRSGDRWAPEHSETTGSIHGHE
jgi:hypothetical protein